MKKLFLNLGTFLLLIKLILSDVAINDIQLDKNMIGKKDKDNSYDFYRLSLPNKLKNNQILVFTARENKKGLGIDDAIFSDPDIYISTENKNPKNKKESDWYSETFGNDIITIPSKDLKDVKVLYVALYCEKKCRYNLMAYLTKEIEFKLGTVNSIKLSKHSSIHYFLKMKEEKYEQLKIVAYSPEQKHFHILMSKNDDTPSTSNSFIAIPSWMGGYMITINNQTNNYCTDCIYHILLQTEEESNTIKFYAFFQNTFTQINSGEPLMDSIEKNTKRCYYYNLRNKDNILDDDKLIIKMTLFGGAAYLHITGYNKDIYDDINNIQNFKKYKYQVLSERNILLVKKDFDLFNKEFDEQREGEKNKLHFCVYGLQSGSYILSVNYINEITAIQRYNYIFPGYEINGFLLEKKLTSYKVVDSNINKNSNITITLKNIQGKAKLYAYFCDSKKDLFCTFENYKLNIKLQSNEMLLTDNSTLDNAIVINNKDNECYSSSSKDCRIIAVIKCIFPEDKMCAYSLRLEITDYPVLMTPRKTYYNFISIGKTDIYKIIITEPEINSLVVVLNTNIGDAQLYISKLNDKDNSKNKTMLLSSNMYNLPDVIRITPKLLKTDNIIGEYFVSVFCKYYSSYNLYYYTSKSKVKKEKITVNDITSTLTEGQIIVDYFPNNLEYKIYSYTPGDKTEKDIKITLTRVNVRFSFYVFMNLKDIKFNDDMKSIYDQRILGYKWVSDSNNEVTILKTDKNYKKKATYYIVVLKDLTTNIENFEDADISDNEDIIMMYYLGVTKEGIPFYLKEGMEHSATLSKEYKYQNYIYTHYNFSQPFQLLVNILNGQVDLFISSREIKSDDFKDIYENIKNTKNKSFGIDYNSTSIYIQKGVNDYASINYNKFYPNDNEPNKCNIFIYIFQSFLSLKYDRDSQYAITAKTAFNKANYLLSGNVYKNKLSPGSEEYFIIEEVKHRESLTITARFIGGTGNIFVKLIDNNEELKLKNLPFPNSTYFDYEGSSVYMGKMVRIPGKIFDKIGKTILKLKILITISTKNLFRFTTNEVEYYISYSNEAKRINQNIPYQSSVRSGEFQYYTFYFDKNAENILISLSNMNGDADLFLNYGKEIYPTPLESDWFSNSLGHEYIDINKNDDFFKKNNKDNLSGYYTLLVIGYTDTTYTLYVSSHDEYVFKLIDNIATNCKCETKDDKCYFRYDNIARKDLDNKMKSTEIIFTSQYLYGNGKMYASVLKEQDIYSNSENKKYIDYFPNDILNDFTNAKEGKRNYLKVTIPEDKYSIDSLVLMTFVCEEKTDVEINVSPLISSGDYKFLTGERENIFYLKYNESLPLKKQPETILAYYSYKDKEAIYEIHAYLGKAKIHIYTNESIWNNVTKSFDYEYNHISEFVIQSKSEKNEQREFKYQKYFTEEYFNSIETSFCKGKTILFSVLPLSNFGFYIQIVNEKTWINVPIGKDKAYYIRNNILYGYFDIFEDFSSVEISVYLKEYVSKRAIIYLKLIVDNKIKKSSEIGETLEKDKLKHYEIPSMQNYDYTAKTDNYLGAMNINIDNIPVIKNDLKNKKIVRALFVIQTYNEFHIPYRYDNNNKIIAPENEGQVTPYYNKFDYNYNKECIVNILVTPGVNNYKRIDTVPYTFYFSNTSLINNNLNNENPNNKIYDGNKEIKIYSLDKISDKDNKMVIQINTCSGDYNIKISSKVVDYDDNSNDIEFEELSSKYGRKIFLLDNLRYKHIYVSIKSKQLENECIKGLEKDSNNVTCSKELSYLLHYYSATDRQYQSAEPIRKIYFKEGNNDNQLIIKIPKLKEFDYHNNYRDKKYIEYNLFWTYNRTESKYIESICYLGHYMEEKDKEKSNITLITNIQFNENNEYTLDNIDIGKPVYINILARNIKTNELILFKPIKGFLRPTKFAKYLSYLVAGLFIFLIVYISLHYYNEENITTYKLTSSTDIGRDEIKYSNLNFGPD